MRIIKITLKSLFVGLLVLALLPVLLLWLLLDRSALIPPQDVLTSSEIETVQQLLISNDPRRLLEAERQFIVVPESDADTLLKYFFSQTPQLREFRGQTMMEHTRAELVLTRPLPAWLLHSHLNIRVSFSERSRPIQFEQLRIGSLALPETVITPVMGFLARRFAEDPNLRLLHALIDTLDHVELRLDQVVAHLSLDDEGFSELSEQARDLLIPRAEQDRIADYYQQVLRTENALLADGERRVSINHFLQALFQQADERSRDGSDPIAENRSLLLALAIYCSELEPGQFIDLDNYPPLSPQRQLVPTLHRRLDLAQHLSISAAVSAAATGSLAELISTYKEVHDARYRTGFSFDDLTANQVGSALGLIATSDKAGAQALQRLMRELSDESDFMPEFTSEEGLSEAQVISRYGDRLSDAYQGRLQQIAAAIAERPIFAAFDLPVMLNIEPSSD